MKEITFTDEKLNLFIDEQLDKAENDLIRNAILDDMELRERVCQLKAVRELVGYAYEHVPEPKAVPVEHTDYFKLTLQGIAAGILIGVGVLCGWMVNEQVSPRMPKSRRFAPVALSLTSNAEKPYLSLSPRMPKSRRLHPYLSLSPRMPKSRRLHWLIVE